MDPTIRVKYSSSCVKKSKVEVSSLCDDCLEHIFKWLPTSDLCSVYETCDRFKVITEKYYRIYRSQTEKVQVPPGNEAQKKIIAYFGEHTRKLIIIYEYTEEINKQIVDVIKSCNEKISYLELNYLGAISVPFKTIENILINLEDIILNKGILGEELISCINLKHLYLRSCWMDMNELWMNNNYPKLRSLSIEHCIPPERETLKEFLIKNPNIEHFTYRPRKSGVESNVWIPKEIINNVKNIREINFGHRAGFITKDLKLLAKCETLKYLQMSVAYDETNFEILLGFIDSLKNHKSLEGFVYKGNLPIELCRSMSKLTDLKVFGLYLDGFDVCEDCCEILSKALINLERLYIDHFHPKINNHLSFIANSKKLKKMYLKTKFCVGEYTGTLERAILKRKNTSDEWPLAIYANKALASNIVEIFSVEVTDVKKVYTIVPFAYETDGMFSRTFFRENLY